MNLFSGLSAFRFRFRDQREQTAEGDGGGDAAGRTGQRLWGAQSEFWR